MNRLLVPLVAAVLLAACGPPCVPRDSWVCQGSYAPSMSDGEQTAWMFNIGCAAADGFTTSAALDDGGRELNPIAGEHPSNRKIAALKVGGLGLEYGVVQFIQPDHRAAALTVLGVAQCGAAAWNLYQVRH